MPKSDTWPGVIVCDTMKEMDSAGSCDSVVSINSTFSDDSLEYLSPEERACLMFLEETIESLETEEDSGLSNDEPDHLPMPGILAARMANLSASMSKSKITDVSISRKAEVVNNNNNNKPGHDHNQVHNYLVPTPLVLANGENKSKNGIVPRGLRSPKPARAAVNGHDDTDSHVFVVLKVTSGTTDHASLQEHKPEQEKGLERSNPRGPLSYEDLVHLRKAACNRKGQETCATLEDRDKQPSKPIKHIPLECDSTHAPTDQLGMRSPVPPAVAPKPKRIPVNIPISPTSPGTDKCPMNPQKVRLEALYKLGLLKEQQSPTAPCPSQPDRSDWARPPGFPPPPPPASKPALDPSYSKEDPTPPAADLVARQTTHWTSGVVHHRSLSDMTHALQPLSARLMGGKSVTLERSGLGLGSSISSQSFCEKRKDGKSTTLLPRATANGMLQHGKPRSKTLESLKDECTGSGGGVGRLDRSASFQTRPQASWVKGHVQSQSANLGVQKLPPRMAEERREALRKLGLLKD